MTPERSVTIWDEGTLRVTAETKADGSLLISGQDFGHPLCDEYEYWITVSPGDVPRMVAALGGSAGDEPLDLLGLNSRQVVSRGEKSWLEDHDIRPAFFNRMGDPRTPEGAERPAAAAPASWDDLTARISNVLEELEADEYLGLVAEGNRFVQVATQDFALRIESVGGQYLEDGALTAEHVAALLSLGFRTATHEAEVDDEVRTGSPNFWMELPTDMPLGRVATLLAQTLRSVHQVASPRDLSYECFSSLGDFIPQPSLGLARVPG